MELVTLFVGRSTPKSLAVTGGRLSRLSLMYTNPKRNSFTSAGEKRCVSVRIKKRASTGVPKGKFSDAGLMMLASVLARGSRKTPAQNGRKLSHPENENRTESVLGPSGNSHTQLVVH